MKRRRLKKWVKKLLSLILVVIALVVYEHVGEIGALVIDNNFYLTICIFEWFYLFFIQFILFFLIWRK